MLIATSALLLLLHQAKAVYVYLDPIPAKDGASIDDPVIPFKWLLVENDVGSFEGTLANPPANCSATDAGYPQECEWPSIRTIKAQAAIYSSGNSNGWNATTPLDISREGKYMVTVMADMFRLCGGYFEVKPPSTANITLNPVCQMFPLPLGTIRMFIFQDNMPCNGQYDPGELPLEDFGIGVNDIEGPLTEDYYGNDILQIVSDANGMIEVPNMW
jgi:hypothetical protein